MEEFVWNESKRLWLRAMTDMCPASSTEFFHFFASIHRWRFEVNFDYFLHCPEVRRAVVLFFCRCKFRFISFVSIKWYDRVIALAVTEVERTQTYRSCNHFRKGVCVCVYVIEWNLQFLRRSWFHSSFRWICMIFVAFFPGSSSFLGASCAIFVNAGSSIVVVCYPSAQFQFEYTQKMSEWNPVECRFVTCITILEHTHTDIDTQTRTIWEKICCICAMFDANSMDKYLSSDEICTVS